MVRRAIFITGASSGIGLATAINLHRIGFHIFAGVLPGEDTSALLQNGTDGMAIVPIDITKAPMIAESAQTIGDAVGDNGLYGLFNNAGISIPGPLECTPMAAIRQQLDVNLLGHIEVTQAMLPLIRRAKGRVVNTVSILGRIALPFSGPYCVSKFGMEAFTDALRQEVKPFGVRVSAVEPGTIATNIWSLNDKMGDEIASEFTPEAQTLYGDAFREIRQSASGLSKRGIPPHEVAEAVTHAFTSSTPRTRYLIGRDANALAMLRRLAPDRVLDTVLDTTAKLTRSRK